MLQQGAGKATRSEELPSISALNPMETAVREGLTAASLLPEAAFITGVSLMKLRLCFLGSMNPLPVTCLLSGKSSLSPPRPRLSWALTAGSVPGVLCDA